MRDTVYIIADSFGVLRMTKREPALKREEVGVRLTVTIPDGCFKAPIVSASVEVAEPMVMQPTAQVDVLDPPVDA